MKYLFFWVRPLVLLLFNSLVWLIALIIVSFGEFFYFIWHLRPKPDHQAIKDVFNRVGQINWIKEPIIAFDDY